jgi:ribonuclease HII
MLHYEQAAWAAGYVQVAGVDEAGRGPLAGPVVSGAVIIDREVIETLATDSLCGLTDSKKLTEKKRAHFFEKLHDHDGIHIGVGMIEPKEIDRINILQASRQSMRDALADLDIAPDFILVDGLAVPDLPAPANPIVKGDGKSLSIAAGSIIAKVTRDRIMVELAKQYPEYGFERHKGYGTKAHVEALREHGPCPAHRQSFKPVREQYLF